MVNSQAQIAAEAWIGVMCDYSSGKPTEYECVEADTKFEAALRTAGILTDADEIAEVHAGDRDQAVYAALVDGRALVVDATTGEYDLF